MPSLPVFAIARHLKQAMQQHQKGPQQQHHVSHPRNVLKQVIQIGCSVGFTAFVWFISEGKSAVFDVTVVFVPSVWTLTWLRLIFSCRWLVSSSLSSNGADIILVKCRENVTNEKDQLCFNLNNWFAW